MNGSPVYPDGQVQIGECIVVRQTACAPHEPGHGSRHFSLRHASVGGQSAELRHSGRQLGGSAIIGGRHEQCATVPCARHTLFGPHGFGEQGSVSTGAVKSYACKIYALNLY